MKKVYKGDKPDGSPIFDYDISEEKPGLESGDLVQFCSGPATGTFEMEDGTTYGVSDAVTIIAARHLAELHLAIHRDHHAAGRFTSGPIPDDEYRSFLTDHVAAGGTARRTLLAEHVADRTPDEWTESAARLAAANPEQVPTAPEE
jgi:hypothetical protein